MNHTTPALAAHRLASGDRVEFQGDDVTPAQGVVVHINDNYVASVCVRYVDAYRGLIQTYRRPSVVRLLDAAMADRVLTDAAEAIDAALIGGVVR